MYIADDRANRILEETIRRLRSIKGGAGVKVVNTPGNITVALDQQALQPVPYQKQNLVIIKITAVLEPDGSTPQGCGLYTCRLSMPPQTTTDPTADMTASMFYTDPSVDNGLAINITELGGTHQSHAIYPGDYYLAENVGITEEIAPRTIVVLREKLLPTYGTSDGVTAVKVQGDPNSFYFSVDFTITSTAPSITTAPTSRTTFIDWWGFTLLAGTYASDDIIAGAFTSTSSQTAVKQIQVKRNRDLSPGSDINTAQAYIGWKLGSGGDVASGPYWSGKAENLAAYFKVQGEQGATKWIVCTDGAGVNGDEILISHGGPGPGYSTKSCIDTFTIAGNVIKIKPFKPDQWGHISADDAAELSVTLPSTSGLLVTISQSGNTLTVSQGGTPVGTFTPTFSTTGLSTTVTVLIDQTEDSTALTITNHYIDLTFTNGLLTSKSSAYTSVLDTGTNCS